MMPRRWMIALVLMLLIVRGDLTVDVDAQGRAASWAPDLGALETGRPLPHTAPGQSAEAGQRVAGGLTGPGISDGAT
jgi:hypothetical protein